MPREEEKGGGKKGEIHTTGRWKKKQGRGVRGRRILDGKGCRGRGWRAWLYTTEIRNRERPM